MCPRFVGGETGDRRDFDGTGGWRSQLGPGAPPLGAGVLSAPVSWALQCVKDTLRGMLKQAIN